MYLAVIARNDAERQRTRLLDLRTALAGDVDAMKSRVDGLDKAIERLDARAGE